MPFNGEERKDIQKLIREEMKSVVKKVSYQVDSLVRQGASANLSQQHLAQLILKMVSEEIDR